MKDSILKPFLRPNLDILFVGLNPANGSNDNGHYFSVNQAFWNQLYQSGLITKNIDKRTADVQVFGDNKINFQRWNYGITDLVTQYAESNSRKIKPTITDCIRLSQEIVESSPRIVVLLHGKVLSNFSPFVNRNIPKSNSGLLGKLLPNTESTFYNIAFPHGNSITSENKVKRYLEVKEALIGKLNITK